MRLYLVIGGIVVGIVIFIVANVMVSFAPDPLFALAKPILCPTGEYSSYGGTIQRSGRDQATRSTECELPNGQKQNVDAQMLGLIMLSSAAPVVITWLLSWVIGLFTPRKPQTMPLAVGTGDNQLTL
jgi:hypothetical protein